MKLYRKIDPTTGNFLEDCLFESHPVLEDGELDTQYVEEAQAQGFYWPRWNGTEWIEGGQAPEPQPYEPTEQDFLLLAITELDMQRAMDKVDSQLVMAELAEMMIGGGF